MPRYAPTPKGVPLPETMITDSNQHVTVSRQVETYVFCELLVQCWIREIDFVANWAIVREVRGKVVVVLFGKWHITKNWILLA